MRLRYAKSGTGRSWGVWPLLLVMLAAALAPAACVLWFMNAAMRNERLAVRQRLTDVYQQQLQATRNRLEEFWQDRLAALEAAAALPPAQAFERIVTSGLADSAVIHGDSPNPGYPAESAAASQTHTEPSPQWTEAGRLENNTGQLSKAADLFGAIAAAEKDIHLKARALQGQARCLAKEGRKDEATGILAGVLAKDEFRDARDASGRLIAPDALMYALQLIQDRAGKRWQEVSKDLSTRLTRYDGPLPPSSQRLFLMKELQATAGIASGTLDAEELAAEVLEAGVPRPSGEGLAAAGSPGIWMLGLANGRAVALWRDGTVRRVLQSFSPPASALAGASAAFHHGQAPGQPFLSTPIGRCMPDWRISLYLTGADPFAAAAERQNALYLWTGIMGVGVIAVLAVALAGYLGRQIRVTRLKNDLIATVSHELKTPLSSMRVLVDTLLEGRCRNEQQAHEYFALIAKENERLSRLIDNFLTFSRMERNKRTFDFAPTDIAKIVRTAADAMRDRFNSPEAQLEVQVDESLPRMQADADALVTVLINLLDNAWKYSGDQKRVVVRATPGDGVVRIEVSDNGTGMSRRTVRRIFKRFYQADQTLSRKAGGCGLGLSIVKFIVDAHGGDIEVTSQVGKGSTFTVCIPVAVPGIEESKGSNSGSPGSGQ